MTPDCERRRDRFLRRVRRLGLEGVVWKRIDSAYEPGERSGAWIKLRTNMEQEFVIGGYIPARAVSMHCSWTTTGPDCSEPNQWRRS